MRRERGLAGKKIVHLALRALGAALALVALALGLPAPFSPLQAAGAPRSVAVLAFSPDDARLCAATHDGVISTWNVRSGRLAASGRVRRAAPHQRVIAACDGRTLYAGVYKSAEVWSVRPLRRLRTMVVSSGYLEALAVVPDGKTLGRAEYFGRGDLFSQVALLDASTGKSLREMPAPPHGPIPGPSFSVASSPDGKWLAWGGREKGLHLWEADTGKRVRVFEAAVGRPDVGENRQVVFSPSLPSRQVAAARHAWSETAEGRHDEGAEAVIWSVENGRVQHRLASPGVEVRSVAFSPRGDRLAVALADGSLSLMDTATGTVGRTFRRQGRFPLPGLSFVTWSCRGDLLATGDDHGRVVVWNARTGQARVYR